MSLTYPHQQATPRAAAQPIRPRLLRLDQAAALCGETPLTFERLVRAGHYPKPVDRPGRLRLWDRIALEERIDQLSGRATPPKGVDLDDEFGTEAP
ncbi:helix-turn-helix transcriptional regulator [Oceanibaculum indicum]|uniref:Uncharacterized protein n=1 Tax=Oceanibaculum indicum P24 TaxID=1207063 RepID=K2IL52_9PROT|nr:hypothetical protein [Oceanibaculum indicum]EKE70861.1 hypothetical protein P24_14999 [Oceanibaculum indicum P24]